MNKIIQKMAGVASMLSAALISFPAHAQNALSASPEVIESLSASDMIAIMQSAGFASSLVEEDATTNTKIVEASIEGGGSVYIALRSCDGAGGDAACRLIQPYGLFPSNGVTLSQINDYNMERSQIAMAGLMQGDAGIIGAKIYLVNGVAFNNFLHSMGLFLQDVDRLVEAIQPGALAEVAYRPIESEGNDNQGLRLFASQSGVVKTGAGERSLIPVGARASNFLNPANRKVLNLGE